MSRRVQIILMLVLFLTVVGIQVQADTIGEAGVQIARQNGNPGYGAYFKIGAVEGWSLAADGFRLDGIYENINLVMIYDYPEDLLEDTAAFFEIGASWFNDRLTTEKYTGVTTGISLVRPVDEKLKALTEGRAGIYSGRVNLSYRTGFSYKLFENITVSLTYSGLNSYRGFNLGLGINY